MKYIRTKDGIFDETEHRHTIKNGKVSIMGIFCEFKQADTIEELCDGYVIEHPINAFKFFYNKEEMQKYLLRTCLRMFTFNELNIYALIKTDKGLIYVAKMNEKGELELL